MEEMVSEAPGGEAVPRDSASEAAGLLSQACAGGIPPAGLGVGGHVWTQTLRAAGVRSGGFRWSPRRSRCSEGPGCFQESRRKVDSSRVWRAQPCREAVQKTPLKPAFVNLKGNRFLDQHFTVAEGGGICPELGGCQSRKVGGDREPRIQAGQADVQPGGVTGTGRKRPAITRALLGNVDDRKSSSPTLPHEASALGFPAAPEHDVTLDDFLYFRKSAPRPGCLQVAHRKGR